MLYTNYFGLGLIILDNAWLMLKKKKVTDARWGKKDGAADNISKQYFEGSYFVSNPI